MIRRRRIVRSLAGLLALFASAAATAAPPTSLGAIVQTNQPLTGDQLQRIQRYVQYWAEQLASDQSAPADAAEASQRLLDPSSTNIASPIFLSAYGREALPRLRSMLEQENNFAAVQAARIMGFLGIPEALDELLPWCSLANEPRYAVRLWASKSCEVLIRRTRSAGVVNERQLAGVLRQLKQAAEREDNWLVLHRQFEALAATGSDAARQQQLEVFESILRRLQRNDAEPSPLMEALSRAMISFRDQFIRLGVQPQTDFGSELAPVLGQVFETALVHWDSAQQDPKARDVYGQAIQSSESLLRFIDQTLRPGAQSPRTDLSRAWSDGDRTVFEARTQIWMDVVQGPPYKG